METTAEAIRPAAVQPQQRSQTSERTTQGTNVANTERWVSLAAGAVLAGLGLARRDLTGALIAGVGGALAYRGATGHCHMYEALGVDTAGSTTAEDLDEKGVHLTECFLIDRPREELYSYWRDFELLPEIMSHLKSVQIIDDKQSEWTTKAPAIAGGEVRWKAEITTDEPNERIAWQTLPGSHVEHRGSVTFKPALGDRGTNVRIDLDFAPPAGRVGSWVAKLFGEDPHQQIRSDLRKFKRLMETGEIPTTEGQPHGKCRGMANILRR